MLVTDHESRITKNKKVPALAGIFYFCCMISKSQVKLIQSLRQPQLRKEEGLYLVEGVKLVEEVLLSEHEVVTVYATSDWEVPASADIKKIHPVEEWELKKISNLTTPNKVLAVVKIPLEKAMGDLTKDLVLLLDRISDPGNMGTIIRTAEWFGMERVIASDDSVDFWNPKVVQASMGSVFRMKLHSVPIIDFLGLAKGIPVYGTLFNGEELGKEKLTPNGIIVIGNESHGISREVQKFITKKLTIPAAETSESESLNASIATAVVCYEFRKQFPE